MSKLTTYERIKRMYEHKDADRVPIFDSPWLSTLKRWNREGMPEGVDYRDYFDIDKIATIRVDNSFRYPYKVIEETDEYIIYTSPWGVTQKQWKNIESTPEFLDFTVVDKDSWLKMKEKMTPDDDRIDWKYLEANYKKWREEGQWIEGLLWFGFDVTHSWVVGTERILIALLEDPEWCMDMFNHFLDVNIQLLEKVWDAGYEFDSVMWYDDMAYKHNQFFSLQTYRDVLKPVHKKAVEWAHSKGIKARLHSDGDINPFIPDLLEIGIDALNPLEVKAGMDPVELKQKYGDRLVLHGGIDALLWDDIDAMEKEIRRILPILKENGGYIFSTDHSIPSSVSLEGFRYIVELVKDIGRY